MIISASRRTDIPAFYGEWLRERIRAGYALVQNPFNPKQITKVILAPDAVDAIVFWTKNPRNFMSLLPEFRDYNYYFLFTITCFDRSVEPGVPDKNIVIDTFKELSGRIGPEKVIWRYDPVFYTDEFDYRRHLEFFAGTARALKGKTHKCIISFLDLYKKCQVNMRGLNFRLLTADEIDTLCREFSGIAHENGMALASCAENYALDKFGISHGKCIDDELISRIAGRKITAGKDKSQRESCNCVRSIDIGAYNTCIHNCRYCYANLNKQRAMENFRRHDPASPLLTGITH
ncbi:MAG: DUF1848 domain-containing protein [Victivallales bacterium]|nr:DUF1848 domain-containing protein [Victivallales bacterium]